MIKGLMLLSEKTKMINIYVPNVQFKYLKQNLTELRGEETVQQ
jgi:hypothetical protein